MKKLLLFALTALMISASLNSQANSIMDKPTLNVSALASVKAMPDFINLIIIISKTAPSNAKAKEEVDNITNNVLNSLKNTGIKEDHIEASEISAHPKYNWTKGKRILIGQEVSRAIYVKLYQKSQYGNVISEITKYQITQYFQQGFGYDNIEKYQNKALLLAIKKARKKAKLIAHAFGRKINKAYKISENSQSLPTPYPMLEMSPANTARKSQVPLDIKPQEINAGVSVLFTLK